MYRFLQLFLAVAVVVGVQSRKCDVEVEVAIAEQRCGENNYKNMICKSAKVWGEGVDMTFECKTKDYKYTPEQLVRNVFNMCTDLCWGTLKVNEKVFKGKHEVNGDPSIFTVSGNINKAKCTCQGSKPTESKSSEESGGSSTEGAGKVCEDKRPKYCTSTLENYGNYCHDRSFKNSCQKSCGAC